MVAGNADIIRLNGAEMLFDAVQLHDVLTGGGHQRPPPGMVMPGTIIS